MLKVGEKILSRQDIYRYFGSLQQIAGLKRFTYSEGKAKGLEAVECRSGNGLRFVILLDRGMDIGLCEYKGIPIAFRSPTGESFPSFFEAQGTEWLRNFGGGLLVTCGLTYLGSPNNDQGEELGLHGRISNLPAEEIALDSRWERNECIFRVKGKVREAKTLFTNMVLQRDITNRLGENRILIKDQIINEGAHKTPFMFLYHINIGYPLLEKGSQFCAPSLEVKPRDSIAAVSFRDYAFYSNPIVNYPDTVFYHNLKKDQKGWTKAALINKKRQLGLYVYYDATYLPNFIQWKFLEDGHYVTGLEPSNCLVEGRSVEREKGTLFYLNPGESREIHIEIGLLTSIKAIEEIQSELGNF